MTFLFQHTDNDSTSTKDHTLGPDATWFAVLASFADFLSGIYGHDIKSKIYVIDGTGLSALRQQQLDEAIGTNREEW